MKQTRSPSWKGATSLANVAPLTASDSRMMEIFMVVGFFLGWRVVWFAKRQAGASVTLAEFCRPWLVVLANIDSPGLMASPAGPNIPAAMRLWSFGKVPGGGYCNGSFERAVAAEGAGEPSKDWRRP